MVRAVRTKDPLGPDRAWVEALTGARKEAVSVALQEAKADLRLSEHIAFQHQASGRKFYAQIGAPLALYALVRLLKPAHVVEVGVSSGVSSSYFLKALRKNRRGTLHSIDFPTPQMGPVFSEKVDSAVAVPPGMMSGWAVPPTLRKGWDLRIGKSQELLPTLVSEVDQIDLFLHDDLHTYQHATWEFRTVDPKVPSGGLVLADNTNWLDGALSEWAAHKGARTFRRTGTWLAGFRKP